MMVTLGVDAHKRSHTVVAVDESGVDLGRVTVPATGVGHLRLVQWAAQWAQRCWGMEDCRHLSRRLEGDLLSAGEWVVRVPPKMMAGVRRSARTRGKSDPIDARAVALAVLREPGLPVARLDGPAREVRLLVDYRESLVRERTGLQCRLRWRLHELEPGWDPPAGSLDRLKVLDQLAEALGGRPGLVAELARREVARIRQLTGEVNQLEAEITARVAQLAPSLLALVGCGALSAAKLVGETADVTRFSSPDAYAMFAGTAPIPVWSGNTERFRLNRGGNRQINAAIHRIAITQMRIHPDARRLITKHMTAGKTKTEALRVLKRRLTAVVYRTLLQDTLTTCQAAPTRAA